MNTLVGLDVMLVRLVMMLVVVGFSVEPASALQEKEPKPPAPVQRAKKPPKQLKPAVSTPTPATKQEQPVTASEDQPAIGGYCPVAYFDPGAPTKGSPEHQVNYGGELYYFSSNAAKSKFAADPDRYLPQFGGLCATALGGTYGNRLDPDPTVYKIIDGKLYLFWSARALRAFETDQVGFLGLAVERFSEPALEGYCTVAYHKHYKALPGIPQFTAPYKGWQYRFTHPSSRALFLRDPLKYLPGYDGYCAEGMSRNKRFKADPKHFLVHKDRLFLFYDAKARFQFGAKLQTLTKKADENWARVKQEED